MASCRWTGICSDASSASRPSFTIPLACETQERSPLTKIALSPPDVGFGVLIGHAAAGDGSALVEFGGHAGNSIMLDASATGVIVFDHASAFSWSISGFNFDDSLDLRDVQFGSSTTVNYADDGTGGGILTISDGTQSVQLHLLGYYQTSDFVLGSDGLGGSMISNELLG